MLIGASRFSAAGLSSPANTGEDPRRFLASSFLSGGSFSSRLSPELAFHVPMDLGGVLDAPLIRRKRTATRMHGLFAVGANVFVSPVMVTLDGGGGLTAATNYDQGWMRSVLAAGGGLSVHANAHMRGDAAAQADGGFFSRLSEYQKVKVRMDGGGGMAPVVSRKQHLEATFQPEGGVRISPWYELIGGVDYVVARRACVISATLQPIKIVCVSAAPSEVITVIEVGI